MNILVSACLIGIKCRYDGKIKEYPQITSLAKKHTLIPVCPEQLGGRPTPRVPVEIMNGRVIDEKGNDYTDEFERGALEVLKIAELTDCHLAILKSKSPSCGCNKIYDGSFSGTLIDGNGITAKLLDNKGINVKTEIDF